MSPGIWVLIVLVLVFTVGDRIQVTPLLAAAPAIACAGTGRRQCVVLGCGCAMFALVPLPGEPAGLGERVGTATAIMAVALASYVIAHRRVGLQRSYDEVRRIADVAQRVLLHPVPERIGPVSAAVGYLAAAAGARIGGDFYEVIETPYGLRAILGDMRGNGLGAVGGAGALLGAFREAGAVEPDLAVVAARLDAALTRYAISARPMTVGRGAEDVSGRGDVVRADVDSDPTDLRSEDFATAVLVQIPAPCEARSAAELDADNPAATDAPTSAADSTAELIICGHPAPYLLQSGGTVRLLAPEDPTPPLGMRLLTVGPQPVTSFHVPLRPGESLVCYTDGITESRDRAGEFFPLEDVLADNCADKAPKAVAEAVRTHLAAHTRGTMHDDAAVLILRRLAD